MKNQDKKILISLGIIILVVILLKYSTLFSVFSEQYASGYINYQWSQDGNTLTYTSIEGANHVFFKPKHMYLDNYNGGSGLFCNTDGLASGQQGICASNFNGTIFAQTHDCYVYGTNTGWYEGDGTSYGAGSYNMPGVVGIEDGKPYCEVSLTNYDAQQSLPTSELYISWWSRPGVVFSWQYTKITSGTVVFTPKSAPVIEKFNYYRFENNNCTLVSIPASNRTTNDYLYINDCRVNIQKYVYVQNQSTVYFNNTINKTIYVNQTVTVEKEVITEPTFFQKYGIALIVSIIAIITITFFRRKK